MNAEKPPALAGQVEPTVRPAVAVAHGSDEHLTLLGTPWHWNLLHGVDRADMLGFGRACMEAERKRIADECRDRARKLTHYERTAPVDQVTQARVARSALLDVAEVVCGPNDRGNAPATARTD